MHASDRLIPPLATNAFQVLWSDGGFGPADERGSATKTSPLRGCHVLQPEGRVVQTYFPHLRKSP